MHSPHFSAFTAIRTSFTLLRMTTMSHIFMPSPILWCLHYNWNILRFAQDDNDESYIHAFSHTLVPSLQLEHMSIFFLPFKIAVRNFVYSPFFHISLKDLCFRSPSLCRASLSKQQGATNPSHVITGSCQSRQQWLASLPLN